MFRTILIANRGEIACRVIATARRMGVATVAIYSDADAQARHVEMADEAYAIGPAPARQSYLRADAILDVARRSGAEAIHPGYGFLSENADFAEACAEAGIVFIGPRPASIRAMGSKAASKTLMEKAGVALVPGYHGTAQDFSTLQAAAGKIGYPVLLKASAGGGGRGMRVVSDPTELADAIDRAKGEARASFGDDALLIEKYLQRPRHIEVQVFGDMHGNIVSLFERDCSVQRRHQKVVEESPAPSITAEQRHSLGNAAIAAARAVDYVGAGTVEFIAEHEQFYFMEMNTRLQVEHPVTEFVTGQDLVEWQLRVAAGERLPLLQHDLRITGHAIEVRICAEDPVHDFRPSTGRITHLRQPPADAHTRIDTGIREGDLITPNYDSMIAKLIVYGSDRQAALCRMARALSQYEIAGPQTNLDLLRAVITDADFAAGDFDTGFIGRHPETVSPHPAPGPTLWAAAVLARLQLPLTRDEADPWSPWTEPDGWRMNGTPRETVTLRNGDGLVSIAAHGGVGGTWRLDLPGGTLEAALLTRDGAHIVVTGEGTRKLRALQTPERITIIENGRNTVFEVIDPLAPPEAGRTADAELTAPTPARVAAVFVEAGQAIGRGEKLLILEAMKVETTFVAPQNGVIEMVHVVVDELVKEGARLVTLAKQSAAPDDTGAATR